jgi:hypothetical protein
MNTFTHIAPQLPPAIDGVGGYCWNLWRHWPVIDVRWQFLALHGVAATREHWREVEIGGFSADANSLHDALESGNARTIVLHYVGYGFQPKGIPIWLPQALRRWRQSGASRKLVTMFHEMYARSSPLRSPFWVAPFARKIIHDLVSISDAWVTSCDRYYDQLVGEFGASTESGRIISIGSNIPVTLDGLPSRSAHGKFKVVCFGLAKTRLWALEQHWKLLRELNERGLIDGITLLGKHGLTEDARGEESFIRRIGPGVEWRRRFDLSTEEISRELLQQDLGIVANEPDILTKSGVFAALANHGIVPIVAVQRAAALPKFVQHAVLSNDDARLISTVVPMLRETGQLDTLRAKLVALASQELSWRNIAQCWSEILQPFSATPELRHEDRFSPSRPIEVSA